MTPEIKCFRDGSGKKDFLAVCGRTLTQNERKYIGRDLSPAANYLFSLADAAYFVAYGDGEPRGHVFVWRNGENGYFSHPEGECLPELMAHAEEYLGSLGCVSVSGPIGSGTGDQFVGSPLIGQSRLHGVLMSRAELSTSDALVKMGYNPIPAYCDYCMNVPEINTLKKTAEKAAARFSLKVYRAGLGIGRNAMPSVAYEVEKKKKSLAALEMERLKPFIARRHSFCVRNNSGECLGYVLTFKNGQDVRIATLMTKEGIFTPPVVLLLVSSLTDSLTQTGIKKAEAALIGMGNKPSKTLAKRLGGKALALYGIFQKSITQK